MRRMELPLGLELGQECGWGEGRGEELRESRDRAGMTLPDQPRKQRREVKAGEQLSARSSTPFRPCDLAKPSNASHQLPRLLALFTRGQGGREVLGGEGSQPDGARGIKAQRGQSAGSRSQS